MKNVSPSTPWATQSYWQGRFASADTPWELGAPSKALLEALAELEALGFDVHRKRVLSPGCGRGADALEFVRRGADVAAIDWSEVALAELRERYQGLSEGTSGALQVVHSNFFDVAPVAVDVVAEHTFFCAIDPGMRSRYVSVLAAWVRPKGFLIGNFFIVNEDEAKALPALSLSREGSGPPFATTVAELEELLRPYFVKRSLHPAAQGDQQRRPGLEWVGVFERV